ncbi:MAG: DNA translocase FtsK 4TM domain-containing protein [Vicinamibacterales bacterium]
MARTQSALSRRVSEILGVALFMAALIWLIALVSHDASDPVWFFTTDTSRPPVNFIGRVGAFASELSFQALGYAAVILPLCIGIAGWNFFWCLTVDAIYTKAIGVTMLVSAMSGLLSLAFGSTEQAGKTFHAGGSLGSWMADGMAEYMNGTGAVLVFVTLILLAVVLSTQVSLGRLFSEASEHGRTASSIGMGRLRIWWEQRAKNRDQARQAAAAAAASLPEKGRRRPGAGVAQEVEVDPPGKVVPHPSASLGVRAAPSVVKRQASLPIPVPDASRAQPRKQGAFTLPPITLLDAPKPEQAVDERLLRELGMQLEEKCREFAVEGQVVKIHPGPVVTTYEFKPEAGVKYARVTSLSDDLCLAMEAESVLIDRLPGKATVGVQIPNPNRQAISLRELLESDAYVRAESRLTLVLGKTIHGEPYVTDLAKMPHLLIAGSTGTGKSVGLNAMLTSLLYRATPDDLRLIMIDPKRLELGMYEEIPHLLTPVVVDPKKAANALRWAVREMEERYKTLAAEGVRNIDQYNRNIRTLRDDPDAPVGPDAPRTLPFIVVVIDELADLMMVASNEVEESICRLAQMARAVGIHLILATQRPSVDVITGLIKANLPSRISFRVSSKIDSRTILDANGAEQLLGKGDMLFMPPASSRAIRLHGPYISEQESARLASFLRKQGTPVFNDSITAEDEKAGPGGIEFEKDDLYDEAARIVVDSRQASISYLQRKLRIGFSRAARLVDMMEAEGLVSAGAGGKAREVLVGPGYFEEVDAQLR